MDKKEVRALMRERTKANQKIDAMILEKIMGLSEYKDAKSVFVYIGIDPEINTDSLVDDMLKRGKDVYVPLCKGRGEMVAKKISSREDLSLGRYNIPEPPETAEGTDPEDLSLVIVPGVAFGRDFSRLGRGAGYYDRFLERAKNATLIAPCRRENLIDKVPVEKHDRFVDLIVTNEEVLRKDR